MQNFSPHEKSDMIYLLKYSQHIIAKQYFQSIVALFLHFTQSWAIYACTCTSNLRPKNMLGENVQYLLNLYIPKRCGVTSAYDDARLFVKIRTRSALCHYSRCCSNPNNPPIKWPLANYFSQLTSYMEARYF